MSVKRFADAQAALGFVLAQTTYIERPVYEIKYADIQFRDLVPIDSTAPEWAKTITFFSSDKFGSAGWINGNADDVPRVDTEMTRFEANVYTGGSGYGYGVEEINQAMMLGINLPNMQAMTARRAADEFMDNVLLRGNTSKNLQGLINNTNVVAVTAPTGTWGTASAAQIVADINAALFPTYLGTQYTSIADTLLLPFEKLQVLAQSVLPNTDTVLLQFIREQNIYTQTTGQPLLIRGVYGLSTAGAGGTARMVAYRRTPEVLRCHVPMPFKFLPPYAAGPLRVEIPGLFRMTGLDIRLPQSIRYLDGI